VPHSIVATLAVLGLEAIFLSSPSSAANIGKLGGTWVLVRVGERVVTAAQAPYFTISGHRISGFDGCNRFTGNLDRPGDISSTRRGCPEGYLKLPLDLADVASHLAAAQSDGHHLRLPARAGFPRSEFSRE